MQICFFSESCVFEVKIDDSIVPLNIAVFDKEGRSLEAWDLFVGAVIDVLGKPTTLRKATLPTIDWLDKQARKIFREKLRLEVCISAAVAPLSVVDYRGIAHYFLLSLFVVLVP